MFRSSGDGSDALPRNGNVQFETNLPSRANFRFAPFVPQPGENIEDNPSCLVLFRRTR